MPVEGLASTGGILHDFRMTEDTPALSASPARRGVPGTTGRPLRLGILVPHSSICPMLAESFVLGIRAAMTSDHAGTPPAHELFIESIGAGGAGTAGRLSRLTAAHRPDLILSMMGAGTILLNDAELGGCGRPIINATLGADVPRDGHFLPNLTTISAGIWQSAIAAGEWAAAHHGKKAVLASSFFDSGFDSLFCLRSGFEAAGGEFTATLLTDSPTAPKSPEEILAAAVDTGADVILSNLSGEHAASLAGTWSVWPHRDRIALIGTAFLSETSFPDQGVAGIRTAASWDGGGGDPVFATSYADISDGTPADLFAMLGWETGHLARHGLATVAEPMKDPKGFTAALGSWRFESPRGTVAMEAATRIATAPHFLRESEITPEGVKHRKISDLPAVGISDIRIAPIREAPLASGWANEYLCI